jgi:hypothetical protein
MNATESANFPRLVSRTEAERLIAKALRLFIGRGKQFSVKQAANGSGVPDRLIEAAKTDPDDPEHRALSLGDLLSLSAFIGPAFTCEWLGAAHQGALWLPDADETPPGQIAADNAEDNATVTRAAIDGKFDRDERTKLRPVGVRMMTRGAQLAGLAA